MFIFALFGTSFSSCWDAFSELFFELLGRLFGPADMIVSKLFGTVIFELL